MNSNSLLARVSFCFALALAGAELSLAQTADTFDSGANWWQVKGIGDAALTFQNGRLEYTTTSIHGSSIVVPGTGANFAARVLNSPTNHELVGSINTDWWAQIDVHVSNAGNRFGASFTVIKYQDQPGGAALFAVADAQNGVYVGAGTWGGSYWTSSDSGLLEDYAIRYSYTAATHTLIGSIYQINGTTLLLETAPFDVTAPSTGLGLGMSADFAGPSFGFMLGVDSHDTSVNSGEIYFDNFRYSGLSDAAYQYPAVPEPSTYAAWAGLAVIGVAVIARRRRNAVAKAV